MVLYDNNFFSNSPSSRDINFHLHSYTHPQTLRENGPHIIEKGEGVFVFDENGKKFFEGMSGLWCTSLGFSDKELIEAAKEQLDKLPFYHSFAGKISNPAIDLSEMLIKSSPVPMSKAYFANSGSEANDSAIKFIWYYNQSLGKTEKRKIISRKRGYHGVTMASGSLTAMPYAQKGFGLPLDFVLHTMTPDYYNESHEGENEEEFSKRCAEELEKLIIDENPDTVAGFFAEPVMGAGGVIVPPKNYFYEIQKILKKYDIIFVADEVICGFGRTGNMWGSQTFNIKPDIITVAKALSSAYLPISTVLINEKVYKTIEKQANELGIFGHGYTYSAHPVCAAVALKTQNLIRERNIIQHVNKVTPTFSERIKKIKGKYEFIGNSRSVGLIGGLELSYNSNTKFDASKKIAANAVKYIQNEGVILRALPGDIVGICPPLIISKQQTNEMFDKIELGLKKIEKTINSFK